MNDDAPDDRPPIPLAYAEPTKTAAPGRERLWLRLIAFGVLWAAAVFVVWQLL
jgi:hypothetical protein